MTVTPVQLLDLLNADLGDTLPFLTSDMTSKEAAKLWLKTSLVKKWEPEDGRSLVKAANKAFLSDNLHCESWKAPDGTAYEDEIISRARDVLYRALNDGRGSKLCLNRAIFLGRPGPGASRGLENTNRDFYTKMFGGPITTVNRSLYDFYLQGLDDEWWLAESLRANQFGINLVPGSKVTTAPKDAVTRRTICTEPSLEMLFQKGLGVQLEDILKNVFKIDLSLQPDVNRAMARVGSIDGSFATIDLKSASNNIAYDFVKWMLDPVTFGVLNTVRCEETEVSGRRYKLHMFSSMGNGFTFPLQTLLFAALVQATYENAHDYSWKSQRTYSVFGDDIIVKSSMYHVLCRVLSRCGFVVNDSKSHHVGNFRESCGNDYFNGNAIRGIYLKGVNDAAQSDSAFNRLARWSIRHGIPIQRVLSELRDSGTGNEVPLDEQDDAGIKTPKAFLTKELVYDRNGAAYYNAAIPILRTIDVNRLGNPYGAIQTVLGGYARSGRLPLSQDEVGRQVVRRKTPCWDRTTDAELTTRGYVALFLGLKVPDMACWFAIPE